MSDDEYFDNDDIFTSAELDSIPLLNEPPDPNLSIVPQVGASHSVMAQPSGSRQLPQTPNRSPSSRLSAIMNALRGSALGGSAPGQSPAPSKSSVFGASTGLLKASDTKPVDRSDRRKRSPPSSGSDSSSGRKRSRKRTRRSPTSGEKRHRSSSPAHVSLEEIATSSKLEGKAEGRVEAWGVVEEECTCAICYDVFVAPQSTPCGHTVCAPCMKQWLATRSTCPMCRTQLNPAQKPVDNLFCAAMIDRLFNEHPDWHVGKPKRAEWNKRKQAWDQEVAVANARLHRPARARTHAPVALPPRRPLFNPEPDSDDEEEDENFRDELLHELALQNRYHIRIYN
ncbi:hypothetical protein FRC08_003640 [Ceratobasidium sp. 394]|nr:hypothetical protein FRC08_003640 [Ceratobasidium sp. 394]